MRRLSPRGSNEGPEEGEAALSGSYVLCGASDLTGIGVGRIGNSNADMVVLCCVARDFSGGPVEDFEGTDRPSAVEYTEFRPASFTEAV